MYLKNHWLSALESSTKICLFTAISTTSARCSKLISNLTTPTSLLTPNSTPFFKPKPPKTLSKMFAFAAPAPLLARSFAGASCARATAARPAASTTMMAKSKAVPFLEAQPALAGWVGEVASFDPLGLSNLMDMKFLREAEIKHCRVAMLGFLGLVVPELYTLPFYSGAPSGLIAVHDWGVAQGPMVQLLLWISGLEIIVGVPSLVQTMGGSGRAPGDFGFDPLGLGKGSSLKNQQYAELVNGRLCMIVTGAIIHHEFISGHSAIGFVTNGFH